MTEIPVRAARTPTAGDSVSPARVRITEMFVSLQGEAVDAGWPTAFVRLTGCPLRCRWCDSAYATST